MYLASIFFTGLDGSIRQTSAEFVSHSLNNDFSIWYFKLKICKVNYFKHVCLALEPYSHTSEYRLSSTLSVDLLNSTLDMRGNRLMKVPALGSCTSSSVQLHFYFHPSFPRLLSACHSTSLAPLHVQISAMWHI